MKKIVFKITSAVIIALTMINTMNITGYCSVTGDFPDFPIGRAVEEGDSVRGPYGLTIPLEIEDEYTRDWGGGFHYVGPIVGIGYVYSKSVGNYNTLFHESTYEEIVHPAGTYHYHCNICGIYTNDKRDWWDDTDPLCLGEPRHSLSCGHESFTEGEYNLQEWTEWKLVAPATAEKEWIGEKYTEVAYEKSRVFDTAEDLNRYLEEEEKYEDYYYNKVYYGIAPDSNSIGETYAYNAVMRDHPDWYGYYTNNPNNNTSTDQNTDNNSININNNDDQNNNTPSFYTPMPMMRFYNPNSGEHFYTGSIVEGANLCNVGWNFEGIGFIGDSNSYNRVYRLYNENAGDHHYTTSTAERDMLKDAGWKYEGEAWIGANEKDGIPVYRLYNPNATSGSHHYTPSSAEKDYLMSIGWQYEGVAWYSIPYDDKKTIAAVEKLGEDIESKNGDSYYEKLIAAWKESRK